jgi:predicted CXXCH cytochrome family protein
MLITINVTSQSIVNSKHNLSVTGTGTIKATSESEICIFCHTPHNSSPQKPLWNREDPASNFTLYNSSTTDANIVQPDGSSLLCLSCHDGTIALGNVLSRVNPILMNGGITTMPPGNSNLTKDISNDHPISFIYNSTLVTVDGQLNDPSTLTGPVKLENQKMQCISCHDPHQNLTNDFLVASNEFSVLCQYCHDMTYWNSTSHNLSNSTWNGSGTDPWPHTEYISVNRNACENCHNPHNADGKKNLRNYLQEENNCYSCHNANVASKNIQAQFAKLYKHNVTGYLAIHDPEEPNLVITKHVECEDCHNPHASNNLTATAPAVNGFLIGLKGVNTNGTDVNPSQYEYEVCYRCHADSPDKPVSATVRQISQNNVRLEFDLSNPSFHPVEGAGVNPNVPSLIAPLTISSKIYCSDCHASDGTGSPAGPHGSIYPQILKAQYLKANNTPESATAYALCYSCHNRNTIINSSGSFGQNVHQKHIVGEDTPCNTCHDPHGISSSQGNNTNNTHLINFNTSFVTPDGSGRLRFEDNGVLHGRCYLICHGESHNPKSY